MWIETSSSQYVSIRPKFVFTSQFVNLTDRCDVFETYIETSHYVNIRLNVDRATRSGGGGGFRPPLRFFLDSSKNYFPIDFKSSVPFSMNLALHLRPKTWKSVKYFLRYKLGKPGNAMLGALPAWPEKKFC